MKRSLVTVKVREGNITQALKVFKKKVANSGHIEETKKRRYYTKPTTERRLIKQQAVRKNQQRVQREREWL